MAPQKRVSRSIRWSHLEDRLYEHVQEAMGMVQSTEDELQLEVDRLRNERDLAREEATQVREEREAATLQARDEAAERVALEKDLDDLREQLTAARHEIGRYKDFLCVAEEDKQVESKARRRAEEDLNQLRIRYEKLVDELRTGLVFTGRPRATQRDVGEFRRSESELNSASRSSYSVSYYPPSSHRTQPSRYTTGSVPGPSNTSPYRQQRPISPPKNTPWAPPSPRKTTSQSLPQDASRIDLDRVSPAKRQSPHPTYTHLRTSAKITAIVPVHHIKKEEEEMSFPPETPARSLQDNKSSSLRRRRSMLRVIQDEEEEDYTGGATEEDVGVLDESEDDEIAMGHAYSDDGTYEARPVKQTTIRKRKGFTTLGSSRKKVKR